jgi:hypothetical protein
MWNTTVSLKYNFFKALQSWVCSKEISILKCQGNWYKATRRWEALLPSTLGRWKDFPGKAYWAKSGQKDHGLCRGFWEADLDSHPDVLSWVGEKGWKVQGCRPMPLVPWKPRGVPQGRWMLQERVQEKHFANCEILPKCASCTSDPSPMWKLGCWVSVWLCL